MMPLKSSSVSHQRETLADIRKRQSPPMSVPSKLPKSEYKMFYGVSPKSDSPEERTVMTRSLKEVENLFEMLALERKQKDEIVADISTKVRKIQAEFHGLETKEIEPIAKRIYSVFSQKTDQKNQSYPKDQRVARRIYFDGKEKAAYIYMENETQRQYVKVIWNGGNPDVECATKIPSLAK